MEHHTTTSRAEAERLLGIAEKLLRSKDFGGCRDFAILAQETEPLLEGSEQILAVAEVLVAADSKRSHPDWYAILQIPHRSDDADLIKKQYRRLALLLHPDKNKYPFSDSAFRLVADSWAVLSDPAKKSAYDAEFAARFTKVDLVSVKKQQQQQFHQQKKGREAKSGQKLPVRRSARGDGGVKENRNSGGGGGGDINNNNSSDFDLGENMWTACPYCYNLYEYPRQYEGCCMRCDNVKCKKAFTAAEILSMPPTVPGKEAYYCCWGFFPMGFVSGNGAAGFPKWMPPIFGGATVETTPTQAVAAEAPVNPPSAMAAAPPPPPPPPQVTAVASAAAAPTEKRKRGRPRKNL